MFGGNYTNDVTHLGNDEDNILTGSSDDDNMNGAQGNDTIDGGTGNDRLVGATGGDLFLFAVGSGAHWVTPACPFSIDFIVKLSLSSPVSYR